MRQPGDRVVTGEAGAEGCGFGKLLSPERRRCAVQHACERHRLSERRACRLLGQWRGTQRYVGTQRQDKDALTRAVVQLAGVSTDAMAIAGSRFCCAI